MTERIIVRDFQEGDDVFLNDELHGLVNEPGLIIDDDVPEGNYHVAYRKTWGSFSKESITKDPVAHPDTALVLAL